MITLTLSCHRELWILTRRIRRRFIRLLLGILIVWLWWKPIRRYIGLAPMEISRISLFQFSLTLLSICLIFLVHKDLYLEMVWMKARTLECRLEARHKISTLWKLTSLGVKPCQFQTCWLQIFVLSTKKRNTQKSSLLWTHLAADGTLKRSCLHTSIASQDFSKETSWENQQEEPWVWRKAQPKSKRPMQRTLRI